MRQHQPLPVSVQDVLAAGTGKLQPAARLSRLQQQMHLRIMPQRFEMPDACDGIRNGLLVYNLTVRKLHFQPKTFRNQPFQDLNLYLAHDLYMNLGNCPFSPLQSRRTSCRACALFPGYCLFFGDGRIPCQTAGTLFPRHCPCTGTGNRLRICLSGGADSPCLLPYHMELGLFLLQFAQLPQHPDSITALRQQQPIGQHRHQDRKGISALSSQPLPRKRPAKPRHGTDTARLHFFHRTVLGSRVNPQLVSLFLPDFPLGCGAAGIAHRHLYPQSASRDLQMGKAVAGGIPGYLIDPRPEILRIGRAQGKPADSLQQLLHALQAQGGTEETGKHVPLCHSPGNGCVFQVLRFQIRFHQFLIAHGKRFQEFRPPALRLRPELLAPAVQLRLQFMQQLLLIRIRLVHLVDKKERRNPVLLQQPPQSLYMPLHPVRAADYQQGIVQHLQRTLHLRAEIHMSGCIQQCDIQTLPGNLGLFGKNRDPPLPLQRKVVKKSIPMVHPAQLPYPAACVQKPFRKRGLSRIHMGQQTSTYMFFRFFRFLFAHKNASFRDFIFIKYTTGGGVRRGAMHARI